MERANTTRAKSGDLVCFLHWLDSLGRTRATGWRWRKKGLITTVNIFGRLYVTREEISRFERRAENGEFTTVAATPHIGRPGTIRT